MLHDVSYKELQQLQAALQQLLTPENLCNGVLYDFIQKYKVRLQDYPTILFPAIKNNPLVWDAIPRALKNNDFFANSILLEMRNSLISYINQDQDQLNDAPAMSDNMVKNLDILLA